MQVFASVGLVDVDFVVGGAGEQAISAVVESDRNEHAFR